MHEKKIKGDLGLVFAIAHITEQGWSVSLPITEHASYDFLAEKNGICKRVQVRYTTPKNGKLNVKLRSSWADKNGIHNRDRKVEDFDLLAVFNPQDKKTYFIDSTSFLNGTSIAFRLIKPRNNQNKNIRYADDFLTA